MPSVLDILVDDDFHSRFNVRKNTVNMELLSFCYHEKNSLLTEKTCYKGHYWINWQNLKTVK